MPFTLDSITFADEFNTGTTTQLVSANVGDQITTTMQIGWSNIMDASLDGGVQIQALTSTGISGAPTGKQAFQLDNATANYFREQLSEYPQSNNVNFEITVSGTASADGTYTFSEIINSTSDYIICTDAFVSSDSGANTRIAITEALTTCDLDYRLNGTTNNNDYEPPIRIQNSSQPINLKTTSAILDATDTVTVNTIPFTYQSANNVGSFTIRGLGITSDVQSFEVIHTLDVAPVSIYNDGSTRQPDNLQIANTNLGQYFEFNKTKYGYKGTFGNSVNGGFQVPINNINSSNNRDLFNSLMDGDVSIIDEKYGNGSTNYSTSNFSIVRTSDSEVSDVPLVAAKWTCTFDIDNATDTPFSNSNTKVKVGIENIPQSFDNTEDGEQTFLRDTAINTLGAAAAAGVATGDAASITNYTCTFNSTSQVSVSFDVEFTAGAQTQINDDSLYFSIFAITQDHTKGYTDSDKVTLQPFKGLGISNILLDPITVTDTKFITAPFDTFGTGLAASEIDGFPVQLLAANTTFSADWTGRTNLRIDTITQLLVLKNSSTLEEITLDTTTIPVNTFNLIDSEYPNANYSIQKGYKIPATEIRNLITMDNISNVSSVRTFEVAFPFFIRWEDYTELVMAAIPSTILDNTQPFDGKNYDVYRIDALSNWSLNYRISFECSESGTTFSQDFDYTIPTSTYDSHPEITSRTITAYKPDGVTLQPTLASGLQAINSVENTWLKYEATFNTAPTNINNFEIEIYAEAFDNGSPTRIQRISSVNSLLSSSWFTDTGAGDGLVLKSIDGNKAVGDVLIDYNKLSKFDNYRIYGTIYDPTVPNNYLVTENDIPIITESGDFIEIE